VRITAHPLARELCRRFGSALVSTSANPSGLAAARELGQLDPAWLSGVDAVLAGTVGDLAQPTPIRDARSGATLRV
jgi:L-threonylcarbamoyladenylate synthase